jgi:protein-tyrosine kinase
MADQMPPIGTCEALQSGDGMNRLFEALSNLGMDQASTPANRPGASSLLVIPAEVSAVKSGVTEINREAKTVPGPLKVARLMATVPGAILQDVTVKDPVQHEPVVRAKPPNEPRPKSTAVLDDRPVLMKVSPDSRLVALTAPHSLGAETFRVLVTRLDNMRKHGVLKSFQVTSSIMNEGKTLVAGNVAVTLAKLSGSKTLLVEGDFHRPALAALLGLKELPGLGSWWSRPKLELGNYIHRLNGMPLWFLPAGQIRERPSDILDSPRFGKAFTQLAEQFEWIVVDSAPMQPITEVNRWSKLVDGTLLVVREGQTSMHTLKKGLQSLTRPKLIGVVMNDVSRSYQGRYREQYSTSRKSAAGRFGQMR